VAVLRALIENPQYTFMRGIARFGLVRKAVTRVKQKLADVKSKDDERQILSAMGTSLFLETDRNSFLVDMQNHGCAFGLRLPSRIIEAIARYADSHPVFAFRDEKLGFLARDRLAAESALGKEILLAQYFNSEHDCASIREVAADPFLKWIALKYLGTSPHFLGCNLWWTFPTKPIREDQLKHAHFFHRDIDDFRFVKFFFYLSDVQTGDGGHWIVRGSNCKSPHIRFRDHFVVRRFDDEEIRSFYSADDILEVTGSKGTGFAEDTLCVHKAASPIRMPRLILQLQFALFDLGVGGDRREPAQLEMIIRDPPAPV
jgi:hypothetical protein